MKKFYFYLGILLLILGIIFSTNSISKITGFSIIEEVSSKTSSTLGLLFILFGIIFLLFERLAERNIANFVETDAFKRQTKRVDRKLIALAIEKIEKGIGHQHQLRHADYKGSFAVRTSKGGRIVYEVVGDKVYLKEYKPSHNY